MSDFKVGDLVLVDTGGTGKTSEGWHWTPEKAYKVLEVETSSEGPTGWLLLQGPENDEHSDGWARAPKCSLAIPSSERKTVCFFEVPLAGLFYCPETGDAWVKCFEIEPGMDNSVRITCSANRPGEVQAGHLSFWEASDLVEVDCGS